MENSFHEIRRQDRLLDDERVHELLEKAEYGFLSLGESINGYAYGIPISFAFDKTTNSLYFHCAPTGHKLENMRKNNKVSFCIVGNTNPIASKFTTLYESVIVFGIANTQPNDEEKRFAIRRLVEKYCPEYIKLGEMYMEKSFHRTHTFSISIERITAKSKK
ncbi:MAG TPA: pyridoxamine 5'-phosphate oxidase family protein [Petrimonas sp.]|nr:pyridoxamine 5'-phosphate oxidase family protein [Petrimonas sp.]